MSERYGIYARTSDGRRLLATCGTPEAVGVAIVTLAAEGEFEGKQLGILDHWDQESEREWIVNPWEVS